MTITTATVQTLAEIDGPYVDYAAAQAQPLIVLAGLR